MKKITKVLVYIYNFKNIQNKHTNTKRKKHKIKNIHKNKCKTTKDLIMLARSTINLFFFKFCSDEHFCIITFFKSKKHVNIKNFESSIIQN